MTEKATDKHVQHPEQMLAWGRKSVNNSIGRKPRPVMAWREPAMASVLWIAGRILHPASPSPSAASRYS